MTFPRAKDFDSRPALMMAETKWFRDNWNNLPAISKDGPFWSFSLGEGHKSGGFMLRKEARAAHAEFVEACKAKGWN